MRFTPAMPLIVLTVLGVVWIGASRIASQKQKSPELDPAIRAAQERQARDAGNISVEPAKSLRFDTALESIARQANVVIIAEGAPWHLSLPANKVPAVDGLHTEAAVKAIANAFDYAVVSNGANERVFLLRKRYSDPRDIPSLTVSECRASLEAIEKGFRRFDPRIPYVPQKGILEPLASNLVITLKPEQIQTMKSDGLRVKSLTADQQEQVRRVLLYMYVQEPAMNVRQLLDRVRALPESALQRKKIGNFGPYVGQAYRDGSGAERFLPVGTGMGGGTYSNRADKGKENSADFVTSGDARIPVTPTHPGGAYFSTIGQVLASIQTLEKATAGGSSGRGVSVAPELEEHCVTLVGDLTRISAFDFLSGVGRLYGGTVQETKGKGLQLTVQRPPLPKDVFGLPSYVQECMPEIFLNASQLSPRPGGASASGHGGRIRSGGVSVRTMAMQGTATERLTAMMKARSASQQRIAFKNLSREDQSAMVVALMGTLPTQVKYSGDRLERMPVELSQFDQLYLMGGPHRDEKGEPKFALEFHVRSSEALEAEREPGEGVRSQRQHSMRAETMKLKEMLPGSRRIGRLKPEGPSSLRSGVVNIKYREFRD